MEWPAHTTFMLVLGVLLSVLSRLTMPKEPEMGVQPPSAKPHGPPPNMGSGGNYADRRGGYVTVRASSLRLEPGERLDWSIKGDEVAQVIYADEDGAIRAVSRTVPAPRRAPERHACAGCGAPRLGACTYCGAP